MHKTPVIAIALLLLSPLFSFGQGAYLKGGVEFRAAANKEWVGSNIETTFSTLTNSVRDDIEQVVTSHGKGYYASLTGGVHLADFLALELEAGYAKSADLTMAHEVDFLGQYTDRIEHVFEAQTLHIVPSLTLILPDKEFSPFLSLGFVMAIPQMKLTSTGTYENADDELMVREYKVGLAPGYRVSGGVEWAVGTRFSLSGTIGATNLTFKPESREITKFEVGGQDNLGTFTNAQKIDTFEEVYFVHSQFNVNTGQYEEWEEDLIDRPQAAVRIPFSSINFGVGLKYHFGAGQ